MEVRVGGVGHVVVDDNVDTLNVNASADQVSGDEDPLVPFLEALVLRQPAATAPRTAQLGIHRTEITMAAGSFTFLPATFQSGCRSKENCTR